MQKMKIVLSVILVSQMLFVNVSGSNSETRIIEYADEGITVIFEDTVYNDTAQYKQIADRLVYGEEYPVKTISWCWLFGHDIQSSTVSVITHNVSSVSPKCLRQTYSVDTCSKCDYYSEELISSVYIVCH